MTKRAEQLSAMKWGDIARANDSAWQFAEQIIKVLGGYRTASLDRATDHDNLVGALDAWWNKSRATHDEHVLVVPKEWSEEKIRDFLDKWPRTGSRLTVIHAKEKTDDRPASGKSG